MAKAIGLIKPYLRGAQLSCGCKSVYLYCDHEVEVLITELFDFKDKTPWIPPYSDEGHWGDSTRRSSKAAASRRSTFARHSRIVSPGRKDRRHIGSEGIERALKRADPSDAPVALI